MLIRKAKEGIKESDDGESRRFYSSVLGKLLWVINGHSRANHNLIKQMVKNNVNPFPYVN